MAHAKVWYGSHCGSSYFARYFYKLVGDTLYHKLNQPYAKWIPLHGVNLDVSEHYIGVTYPAHDGCEAISFGLVEA